MSNLEHPEITAAQQYGYPEPGNALFCGDCGAELVPGTEAYERNGDLLCVDCTKERIRDSLCLEDLASAMGFVKTSYEALTGGGDA